MISGHALNFCNIFFGRLGIWFLTGPSLAEFCCNRRVNIDGTVYIGMIGVTVEQIISRFSSFNVTLKEQFPDAVRCTCYGLNFEIGCYSRYRKGFVSCVHFNHIVHMDWLLCSPETCQEIRIKNNCMADGMWRVPLSEYEAIEFRLPYMIGAVLDAWKLDWWKGIEHDSSIWRFNDVFFDKKRTANGIELINQMYACAKKAKIDHAMFIGFGTALGLVRHGGFIPSDRDMDMCIVADWITVEQALEYVRICKESGLGEHRWVTPQCREDTGMPLWFSLGPKNPVSESGIKSCNWFWFSHGGYWWHSKGGMWVSPTKFSKKKTQYNPTDAAIAKGIPASCLTSLVDASFLGAPVKAPDCLGACLDHWYPCWPAPHEGASAHEWVMVIEKWEEENTWRIG
jgi:hypothetical protein